MNKTFLIPGIPDAHGYYVDTLPEPKDARALLPFWQAKKDELFLRVPSVGGFRAFRGTMIEVALAPGVDPSAPQVYLQGAMRAALIQQRGEIALHASCVSPPSGGFAVALCGVSGAGKSTLAAALGRRGWTLLADDLTRVQPVLKGANAWPADSAVQLWKDSCEQMSIGYSSQQRVRPGAERFFVPMSSATSVLPLRLVLDLRYGGSGVARVDSPIEKMVLFNQHVFRRRQIAALEMQSEHAKAIVHLATRTEAGILHGSRTETSGSLADRVEEARLWIQP